MPPVGDMSCFPDETSDVMSFFSGATMPPVGDILMVVEGVSTLVGTDIRVDDLVVVDRVLDVLASFETHLPATMVEPDGQDLPSEDILVRKA